MAIGVHCLYQNRKFEHEERQARVALTACTFAAFYFEAKGILQMATKVRKRLTTKAELELAKHVGFNGKYLDTLLDRTAEFLKLDTQSRLPDAQSYLRAIKQREADQVKEKWGLTLRQYHDLQDKADEILRGVSSGYSMGDRKFLFVDGNKFAFRDDCKTYSKSCTWAPKHGEVKLTLSMKQLKAIELIEGVWTIRGKNNTCHWLSCDGHHRKFRVFLKQGFLVGTSHGKSLAECEALELAKTEKRKATAKNLLRFVGLIDRESAGACEPGVLSFCARHGLDPTMGYRIDFLISLNDSIAKPYLDRLARLINRSVSL